MNAGNSLKGRILRVDAIGMALCAALSTGAYFVGVEPVINIQARVEEQERLIDEQLRIAADSEQLLLQEQTKLAELKRRLNANNVQLAPPTDINRRLDRISRLLESHGLTMQTLDPGTAHTDPELGKFVMVPIRLAGRGSFAGMTRFLHQLLSKEFPDVELRSLNFSAPTVGGPATEFEPDKAAFLLELRWYAAPAESTAVHPVP
jgi:Tfp pilus assembly protein PilO